MSADEDPFRPFNSRFRWKGIFPAANDAQDSMRDCREAVGTLLRRKQGHLAASALQSTRCPAHNNAGNLASAPQLQCFGSCLN
jgi:hypothetical protein